MTTNSQVNLTFNLTKLMCEGFPQSPSVAKIPEDNTNQSLKCTGFITTPLKDKMARSIIQGIENQRSADRIEFAAEYKPSLKAQHEEVVTYQISPKLANFDHYPTIFGPEVKTEKITGQIKRRMMQNAPHDANAVYLTDLVVRIWDELNVEVSFGYRYEYNLTLKPSLSREEYMALRVLGTSEEELQQRFRIK